MTMGTVIVVLVLLAVIGIVWKMVQAPDKNGDGKVDAQDVVIAAKEVADEAKAAGTKAVEKVKKARKKKAE
jgi:Na+-transporting methylmalonyl-CoA/oxaloacetate decarboxylase gamma subunit